MYRGLEGGPGCYEEGAWGGGGGISMGGPAEGQGGWLGCAFQDLGNYFTREIGEGMATLETGENM